MAEKGVSGPARRFRIADLFCGAGGAGKGLHDAGFEVVGVDINPQPQYPYEFIQADALAFMERLLYGFGWQTPDGRWWFLSDFDAIWASPPCQGYSVMNNLPWLKKYHREYLILPVREKLEATGLPYIIENVMGARYGAKGLAQRGLESHGMQAGWLCGGMFGKPFYRHRLFETNWFWMQPGHPKHRRVIKPGPLFGSNGGRLTKLVYSDSLARWQGNGAQKAGVGVGVGHAKGWRLAAEAMGIDWMTRAELTQAIPPAYSEYLGRCLMDYLTRLSPCTPL